VLKFFVKYALLSIFFLENFELRLPQLEKDEKKIEICKNLPSLVVTLWRAAAWG